MDEQKYVVYQLMSFAPSAVVLISKRSSKLHRLTAGMTAGMSWEEYEN